MRKMRISTLLIATSLALSTSFAALAEIRPLVSGSGGEQGNYYGMMNDINSEYYCRDATSRPIVIETTDGSVENIIGMGNKRFAIAPVQEDVLQFFAKKDPGRVNKNRLKILVGLHTETLHLLIPKDFKPSNPNSEQNRGWGSTFSDWFGSEDKQRSPKIEISMLKNQTIGSWGGSMVSAKALSFFMDLNLNVQELKEADRVNPNMPLLLVGGQPYSVVETYLATGKYHLVGVDFNQINNRAPFYQSVSANYRIGGRLTSIPTVGVRAFLVGTSYRKEERNQDMVSLAACITENLADLADDPDTNSNWGSVYELERSDQLSDWSYFNL